MRLSFHPFCQRFQGFPRIAGFILWLLIAGPLLASDGSKPPALLPEHVPSAKAAPVESRAAAPGVPAQLDRALRDRQDLLTTSNLLTSPVHESKRVKQENSEQMLEIARGLRERKELALAKTNLVELVTGDHPADIKRSALLELALLAQDQNDLVRAQQVFSQFLAKYPTDPNVPEVLLRQGLLFRQMGAYTGALSKFYAVMSKSLNIESAQDADHLEYYQHLVLQAKTEIADTYYEQGRFADAADYFLRLLKLDDAALNRNAIRVKLVRSLAHTDRTQDLINHAQTVLRDAPDTANAPEIRYELAKAYRQAGRTDDALAQVFILLQQQEAASADSPSEWDYWRLRVGNDLANQLYASGDYLGSLQVYQRIAELNLSPAWQVPARYQVGLAFERLQQPAKAAESFTMAETAGKSLLKAELTDNLKTIVEMAAWRREHLDWNGKTEATRKDLVLSKPKPKEGAELDSAPK